jgi:NodT family efflux transporter outer membrane factor (OMF) lipoprotein
MSDPIARRLRVCAAAAVLLVSSGCMIGPKYVRPEIPSPAAFKEAPPAGWSDAQPSDGTPRGAWWTVYQDPGLDALENRVSISNQNVLAADAQLRAAKAAVRVTRAGLFPTLDATPSATVSGKGGAAGTQRQYSIPLDLTYQTDVWGNIRRSVAANSAVAQASAAELENARLLYQSELAEDYFQIQGLDAERTLLEATVQSYERNVQLTQDRFDGGVASQGDVALAQTQLETVRAQSIDLGVQRAQFEHAIAVLTGHPPSELSMPDAPKQSPPPVLTVGLPSSLLERRPDIAAAERQVAAANEEIGVAKSALFPSLNLGASAGSQAGAVLALLSVPTRAWSLGAQVAETLFDGGKRRAQVKVTQASYDAAVANYRQTVLTGFQQVEDNLSELRILADQAEIVDRAVAAAQQSLDISTTQYRGGLANYLQVITAQTSLLQNQRAAVDILTRRLVASVSLVQALGGGWDAAQLPSALDVRR